MHTLSQWLLLAGAGALGSLSRYALSSWLGGILGSSFPWGIFVTNVLGCFLFGCVWTLAGTVHLLGDTARIIILTGFMGAFTTFSTLVFDCHILMENGQWLSLFCNLCGQILLGLLALQVGIRLVTSLCGS